MNAAQAHALAKLAGALDLAALKGMASDEQEAASMRQGLERLSQALADAGLPAP